MQLSELVEINENGTIANSVNFDMMDDAEMNRRLCEGFIFNYDPQKPTLSTVGILDVLRDSFHSRSKPNVHLMIQQYGRGKSHFALAIANYFKRPYDSPEVRGILKQIEIATTGKPGAIAERLIGHKRSTQHNYLVICLSGDRGGDLRKHFLRQLLNSLEEAGVKDSVAQHICRKPLEYLEGLNEGDRAKAEAYLEAQGNPDGDLENLIQFLRENNPNVIDSVKDIVRHIANVTPEFSADIDIEAILQDIIDNLCKGENRHFEGVLILFDELRHYLECWATNPVASGGTALQNITNICENNKAKIALLSFSQISLSLEVGISANSIDSYKKLSSRLAPLDTTYDGPASSLELVIDNLLIQKETEPARSQFLSTWDNTLLSEGRNAFEKRAVIYKEKGWSFQEFYQHLSRGCFPLHPITAYLLCNFNFTQDRTAIQFIKGYVRQFVESEPADKNGMLNYIYPVALVDTFLENFPDRPIYQTYQKAVRHLNPSEHPREIAVLKALFLYDVVAERLAKSDREDHEELLVSLTGLRMSDVKAALKTLQDIHDVIYYRRETKLYQFYEGANPRAIETEIKDKIADKKTSVKDAIAHATTNLKSYLGDTTLVASHFVRENELVGDDWKFQYQIKSIDQLIKWLNAPEFSKSTSEKGILVYVLATRQEELQEFRQNIDCHLGSSPNRHRIAIAIPQTETGDLERVILGIQELKNMNRSQQQSWGVAHTQLLKRWNDEVDTKLKQMLNDCTYHSIHNDKIAPTFQNQPQRIVSTLLQELYHKVPPVGGVDKMKSGHQTGGKISAFVAKQLMADNFNPQGLPSEASYKTVIDKLFCDSWKLFRRTPNKYVIQPPKQEHLRAAWDKISALTDIGDRPEKAIDIASIWQTLSDPPFGCNQYVFTVLFSAWMADHRQELMLQGPHTISTRQAAGTLKTQTLKDWAIAGIFDKSKDFIEKWIPKAKLIRRERLKVPQLPDSPITYDVAQEYIAAVEDYLKSGEVDDTETTTLVENKNKINDKIKEIDRWFSPVKQFERLADAAEFAPLLDLYPKLSQSPPSLESIPNMISVQPTQEQRDHHQKARQMIRDKLETQIADFENAWESFTAVEDCDRYQKEAGQMLQKMGEVAGLPEHLAKDLQAAIKNGDRQKIKLQQLNQDRETVDKIRSLKSDTPKTIRDCQRGLEQLETLTHQLCFADNYQGEIDAIRRDLETVMNDSISDLTDFESRLKILDCPSAAEELQETILERAHCYLESEFEERYKRLKSDIRGVVELLKITANPGDTIADYQYICDRLRDWKQTQDALNPRVEQKFEVSYRQIESEQNRLRDRLQSEAENWLKSLEQQAIQLHQILQDTERLESAKQLSDRIEAEQSKYIEFLGENHYHSLTQIKKQCRDEQNKDKANQIITLFRQLPRLQRQDIYAQLANYLTDGEEDRNG